MDAYDTRKKSWEDLDVTREEFNSFTECLKKEEFRKLLIEYAEEVSNPENRKLYEKEIKELEKERGVDVTFVNPEPGYVIKTSLNGDKKCFVNISKSETVGKPSSQPLYEDGHRGLHWSIPYSLSPPREDYDKKNVRCTVFDVVFHPDTIYLASKNPRFADIVNNTAIDGVESSFKVKRTVPKWSPAQRTTADGAKHNLFFPHLDNIFLMPIILIEYTVQYIIVTLCMFRLYFYSSKCVVGMILHRSLFFLFSVRFDVCSQYT